MCQRVWAESAHSLCFMRLHDCRVLTLCVLDICKLLVMVDVGFSTVSQKLAAV